MKACQLVLGALDDWWIKCQIVGNTRQGNSTLSSRAAPLPVCNLQALAAKTRWTHLFQEWLAQVTAVFSCAINTDPVNCVRQKGEGEEKRGWMGSFHSVPCALYYPLHHHAFHSAPHYHGTHPTGCLISQRAFAYWIKSSETEPAQPNGKRCSSRQAEMCCHHFSLTSAVFLYDHRLHSITLF